MICIKLMLFMGFIHITLLQQVAAAVEESTKLLKIHYKKFMLFIWVSHR